jgi:ATP-dependent DNA helicase RecG
LDRRAYFFPASGRANWGKPREKTREKTREKIIGLVRANPDISMETMASSLGLTRNGVEWQICKLKQSGILRRVGPDKGGQWEILI